jgi:hypothetical protein
VAHGPPPPPPQLDPSHAAAFFATAPPQDQQHHHHNQLQAASHTFGVVLPNGGFPPGHPAFSGRRFYTIQRVNGNGGNGKGDGVAGPHKHTLEDSDRIKKNSVVRHLLKDEKERKKTQVSTQKGEGGKRCYWHRGYLLLPFKSRTLAGSNLSLDLLRSEIRSTSCLVFLFAELPYQLCPFCIAPDPLLILPTSCTASLVQTE